MNADTVTQVEYEGKQYTVRVTTLSARPYTYVFSQGKFRTHEVRNQAKRAAIIALAAAAK